MTCTFRSLAPHERLHMVKRDAVFRVKFERVAGQRERIPKGCTDINHTKCDAVPPHNICSANRMTMHGHRRAQQPYRKRSS